MTKMLNHLELEECSHCNVAKPLLIKAWDYETHNHSGDNRRYWKVYLCRSCGGLITTASLNSAGNVIEMYPAGIKETFEFTYLPEQIAEDFQEALDCYSINCFSAFGAMARRTVQSMSSDLGAKGKSKVLKQLQELREVAEIDDETFSVLEQVIIGGHDGAHPHLPKLSPERAAILLELMKDVLYQLYVRKAKIQKAIELRKKEIEQSQAVEN